MEFETPNHSLFDFYQIANWDFEINKDFDSSTQIELIVYVNELLIHSPWMYVKEIGIRNETARLSFKNHQEYIDYMINLFSNSPEKRENLEWDVAVFECGLKLNYQNTPLLLTNKNEVQIHVFHDPDTKKVILSLSFSIDLFTQNPSRQPDVYLSDDCLKWNIQLLDSSLRSIEESKVFKIAYFDSDFHPDLITKYGFKSPV